jgi:nicotinamidase-related amidase
MTTTNTASLIERSDSLLIVVDVQDNFTAKLEPHQSQQLLERVPWLMRVATWCEVQLLVTVEDLTSVAGPSAAVQQAMPADTPVFDKLTFGLADQADILAAVEATQRSTVVLIGLETDVCIMQSALGLQARGYRVVVLADATCSPGAAHEYGLARMRATGVIITDSKGLLYEWLRTVAESRRFDAAFANVPLPTGLLL